MIPSGLQRKRTESFLFIAGRELEAVRRLGQELPEQAAYFLQQTLEKLIRALLEAEAIPAGVSHNLRTLADILPKEHPFADRFVVFDDLSSASTRFRYPTNEGRVPTYDPKRLPSTLAAVEKLSDDITAFIQNKFSRS